MLKKLCQILIFFGLFPVLAEAAIYKWVDEDGKIHYSQQKPINKKTEKIKVYTHTPDNSSTYKKPSLKKKEDENQGSDKAVQGDKTASAQKPQKTPQERAKLCRKAQTSLQTLMSRGRVRLKDDKGNISYMPEEQKQQRIQREKDRINENCK